MTAAWIEDTKQEAADAPASLPGLCPSNCGICCQQAASAAEMRSNMRETSFLSTVIYLNGKLSLFLSSSLPAGFLLSWLWISGSSFYMSHADIWMSLGLSFSFIFYLALWKRKKPNQSFRCRSSYIGATLVDWCPGATKGDTVVWHQGSWGSALRSIFSQLEPYKLPLMSHNCSVQGHLCSPEHPQDASSASLQPAMLSPFEKLLSINDISLFPCSFLFRSWLRGQKDWV